MDGDGVAPVFRADEAFWNDLMLGDGVTPVATVLRAAAAFLKAALEIFQEQHVLHFFHFSYKSRNSLSNNPDLYERPNL